MYIPPVSQLVKGAKYVLIKTLKDNAACVGEFVPPHTFKYMGIYGVGDHQDQHEFMDEDGRKIAFCPALNSIYGAWNEYLTKLED